MMRAGSSTSATAGTALAALATAGAAAIAVRYARRQLGTAAVRAGLHRPLDAQVTRRRPGNVGDALHALETPCLVVDLDAVRSENVLHVLNGTATPLMLGWMPWGRRQMEKNLAALPKSLQHLPGVAIRPHAKAHKSSEIGQLQLKLSKVST
jgi:hypothetical protein